MFRIFVYFFGIILSVSANYDGSQIYNGQTCSFTTVSYDWHKFKDGLVSINNNTGVMFKFYVQGKFLVIVRLREDPMSAGYRIIIGSESIPIFEIHRSDGFNMGEEWNPTTAMKRMLDEDKYVGFWIRASQRSGLIEVGREDDDTPFMYWTDPSPVPIRYFSFNSILSTNQWLYNCRPITSSDTTVNNDNERQFLTYAEKLRRDVLNKISPFGRNVPTANEQQLLNVAVTTNFKYIHLDVMTSTLALRGYATFEWTDNGIRWDPREYKNISKLHLSNYELWRPELVLHNSIDPASTMFSETKISVDDNGRVTWRPKFDVKTKCDIDLKSWPWDKHKCTVLLSPWSQIISNVFYEIIENNDSECFHTTHSDWKLDGMTNSYVEDKNSWQDIASPVNINESSVGLKQVSLQLVLEISRNTKIFENLFYTPLILISCLWLSSFCLMPNPASKITIICTSIVLSMLVIIYMTKYVPVFYEFPPNLMLGYLKLMLLISTDAFVSSFLITFHRRTSTNGHPPLALIRFLTMPFVTMVLVLPKLDNNDYGQMDNEPEEERATETTLWDIAIIAFERVMFIAYFIINMIVLLSARTSS